MKKTPSLFASQVDQVTHPAWHSSELVADLDAMAAAPAAKSAESPGWMPRMPQFLDDAIHVCLRGFPSNILGKIWLGLMMFHESTRQHLLSSSSLYRKMEMQNNDQFHHVSVALGENKIYSDRIFSHLHTMKPPTVWRLQTGGVPDS